MHQLPPTPKSLCAILSALCLLLLTTLPALAEPVAAGQPFPEISLAGDLTQEQKTYLGLSGDGPWQLKDVTAQHILIEVFSMYCPHCQAEAPSINTVFEKLAASAHGNTLKMLGIGAGNSRFEVQFFKKKYGVSMPLFEDADLDLHTALGQPGTPHYFLLTRKGDTLMTVHSATGRMESPEAFLDDLVMDAGLKP